jgi:hypothetical protein
MILGAVVWTSSILVAFTLIWSLMPAPKALAAVTNSGVAFFGDNSATSQGVVRARTFTSPSTWGTQFNTAASSSTSFVNWIVAKSSPVKDETMIGALHVNGTLDIQTCTTGCDATGDYTAQWNNPGTSVTQQCTTTTAGDCTRPYDIGYESLSGKAMVAYTDNTNPEFYYALWDGSSWSPNATPGSPNSTNKIDVTSCHVGQPRTIKIIPDGSNLDQQRTDRMMLLIGVGSHICAYYWDGSTFDSGTLITNPNPTSQPYQGQPYSGAWTNANEFVVTYGDSSTNQVNYNTYTVGTGWGTGATAFTTNSSVSWLEASKDPTSSRVFLVTAASGEDTRSSVWRGDDATDGWTTCNTGASTDTCPDTTTETLGGDQASGAFERFNGDAIHIYNNAGSTADSCYFTYTQPSTWGPSTSCTRTPLTTTDDALMVQSWGSPNSAQIMTITEDVDCKAYADMWDGSAWDTGPDVLNNGTTATLTNYSATCPLSTTPGAAPIGVAIDYGFVWRMYSPWQRNWQFYSGTDTASTPTTSLAAQNTTPTGFDPTAGQARLRINYGEVGTLSETDSRKKLQYTSGCNPNTSLATSCTWTDVDSIAGAGIWRYFDPTCTPTDCADNILLTSTVLTGSGACTLGNGCGTWVLAKSGGTVTNMDHNGSQVQEGEWDIEANSAASSTTYYFRVYDTDQQTPLYTYAYSSNCGSGGSSACTYPSITTGSGATGPTTDQLMYNGDYFSGGSEQSLFWAN